MGKITEKSVKILWGSSGNLCAFPECNIEITAIPQNTGYTLGEMAHIKGDKPKSCRYDCTQSDEERHSHNNLILLCPTHHTIIDKPENLETYTVDFLKKMKEKHLQSVKNKLKMNSTGDLKDLKQKISIYLAENNAYFYKYGPLSEIAQRDPSNTESYKLWLQIRLEKIIPNNNCIVNLLKSNREIFDNTDQKIISEFITHAESYNSWVFDDKTYKSVLAFPKSFEHLILG